MSEYAAYSVGSESDLAHYGVPGMKWGVRKDRGHSSGKQSRASYLESKYEARTAAGKKVGRFRQGRLKRAYKREAKDIKKVAPAVATSNAMRSAVNDRERILDLTIKGGSKGAAELNRYKGIVKDLAKKESMSAMDMKITKRGEALVDSYINEQMDKLKDYAYTSK